MTPAELQRLRLEGLEARFYSDERTELARGRLARPTILALELPLDRLLRNHVVDPIRTEREVLERDSFDFLLSYYGLVEIALIAGHLTEPLPEDFVERTLSELEQVEVVRYYEVHYPLLLPQLLRRRLQKPHGRNRVAPEHAEKAEELYMLFLALTASRQRDANIEGFLWLLDDGIDPETGSNWTQLIQRLDHPEEVQSSLRRFASAHDRREALDVALVGLFRYLDHCHSLARLIRDAEALPELASGFWHLDAYWFRHLRTKVGSHLDAALEAMAKWDGGSVGAQSDVRRALLELLSGEYAQPLDDLAGSAPADLETYLRKVQLELRAESEESGH